jgi:hypothetical protein
MRKITLILVGLFYGLSAYAQTADLILLHGKILTVDANDFIAQAVAIRQGKSWLSAQTNRSFRWPDPRLKPSICMEKPQPLG